MIYSLFLLAVGVFIGQEYPLLPSIKLLVIACYENVFKKEENSNGNGNWWEHWLKN